MGASNENIHRYIRYLPGGDIYEMIFNWSAKEQTYSYDKSMIINTFTPNKGEADMGDTLPAYGTIIHQLSEVPKDYKTNDNSNCVQRRAVKKTNSDLILKM